MSLVIKDDQQVGNSMMTLGIHTYWHSHHELPRPRFATISRNSITWMRWCWVCQRMVLKVKASISNSGTSDIFLCSGVQSIHPSANVAAIFRFVSMTQSMALFFICAVPVIPERGTASSGCRTRWTANVFYFGITFIGYCFIQHNDFLWTYCKVDSVQGYKREYFL